jgi:hypothetical protein
MSLPHDLNLPPPKLPLVHRPLPVSVLPASVLLHTSVILPASVILPTSVILPVLFLLSVSALLPMSVLLPATSLPTLPLHPGVSTSSSIGRASRHPSPRRIALKSSQRASTQVPPPPEPVPGSKVKGKRRHDPSLVLRAGKRARSDKDAMSTAPSAGK